MSMKKNFLAIKNEFFVYNEFFGIKTDKRGQNADTDYAERTKKMRGTD